MKPSKKPMPGGGFLRSNDPAQQRWHSRDVAAIALALQHQRPLSRVSAVDASQDALTVAEGNAQRLQLPVGFIQSHWLRDVTGTFDLIVSKDMS